MKTNDNWHKRFVIKKSRPGLGNGLFARVPIRKGAFILEYIGKKILTSVADEMTTRYLFEINKKWTIDGSVRTNIARYINHSCDPNCETDIDSKDRIIITVIKNIKKGEELSFDYGDEYYNEFIRPDGCGCPRCKAGYKRPLRTSD